MKMKRFFFGALGLLALASCSNDELTSVNRDGDEIAFSVVTNSATRAADVYCNNNKPNGFKVWATCNNATYINGDQIIYNENNSKWENTSGTRYWPDDEVTFFAHVNAGGNFEWNNGSPEIKNFTVETNVREQKDLLYAVKKTSKTSDGGQAKLNFRHALSQIVFQAKNTNPNLYVEISGVSVCKVKNQGKFTYPTSDTDDNIEDHTGTANTVIDYNNGSWGKWNNVETTETYSVTFDAVPLVGEKNAIPVSLTNTDETNKDYNNVMLLLPQTSTAWVVGENATTGKPENQDGTYFLVKCRIYNVADSEAGKQNDDVCLWGADGAADVAIPVTLKWEQGKKYIYTFVFGDGNGGYDPDPDPEDPDSPKPVLVPITFVVTVDDFVPVDNENIEMDKPEEEGK